MRRGERAPLRRGVLAGGPARSQEGRGGILRGGLPPAVVLPTAAATATAAAATLSGPEVGAGGRRRSRERQPADEVRTSTTAVLSLIIFGTCSFHLHFFSSSFRLEDMLAEIAVSTELSEISKSGQAVNFVQVTCRAWLLGLKKKNDDGSYSRFLHFPLSGVGLPPGSRLLPDGTSGPVGRVRRGERQPERQTRREPGEEIVIVGNLFVCDFLTYHTLKFWSWRVPNPSKP